MMTVLIIIHVIACILLITLVLIQRGRGGGLVESFSGVESMFGTKTSSFLTRSTTVLSVLFFLTCLSLAILSVRQSKSLLINVKPSVKTESKPLTTSATETAPKSQESKKTE
ncbi:MAG: preprotein translocase subunit SecG [Candidatus Omnitrophica bacterium]|nr:preprotein translocase subunit SecG [Candidatus Omnitrophota bacterium]